MRIKFLTVSVLSISMLGCAGFRANNLPVIPQAELTFSSEYKPKIFSRWGVETRSAMISEQVKVSFAAIHKKYFEDAIERSGCCILVEGPTEADLVVDGIAFAENNSAAMIPTMITGMSFFAIPSWVTAKTHIRAEATRGPKLKNYDLQDSITMVQWLPLIVAFPIKGSPIKEGIAVDENVYSNLLVSMKKDGLLQ